MRITFMNKLVFADPQQRDQIKYAHHFRVNADLFIRYKSEGDRNWDIAFSRNGASRSIPEDIRNALIREFKTYIRLRVKKNVNDLKYADFIDMANAVSL